MFFRFLILILIINCYYCIIAPPQIETIQRIRLNAFRVRWSVPNSMNLQLSRSRITVFDGATTVEWPSQAVRVEKDGDDAQDIDVYIVSSYLECVKLCLGNPRCNFVVRSGSKCFLKASTPTNGQCAKNDECAVVLAYSNEANLYELPMNKTYRLQVQVYDMNSKNWSTPSQLSDMFTTSFLKPQIVNQLEVLDSSTIRVKWTVPDPTIINPTRYVVSFYRFNNGDVRDWPAQMKWSDVDGQAEEYNRFPRSTKSDLECKNACLRDKRCLLAIRDSNYCYLKGYPEFPGPCGYRNGCWTVKGYTSFADLSGIPFNDIYKFQVSIYDEYSETWSLTSDYSMDFNLRINLTLTMEQVDDFSYKLHFDQIQNRFPIVRFRVLLSKNGSAYYTDSDIDNKFKGFALSAAETTFNNDIAINQGYFADPNDCVKFCVNSGNCVGVKLLRDNCYTAFKFDPFTSEDCMYDGESCYSVLNNANDVMLDSVDASTTYSVQLQYFTKYNTTGYSNIVTFNTTRITVQIQSSELMEQKPGSLLCVTANSSLVSQIIWQKDDKVIDKFQEGVLIEDNGRRLIFTNLSRFYDNGKYMCSIRLSTNNQLLQSDPFYLTVKFGPFFMDMYANNSRFTYNTSDIARFNCSVTGYGPYKFGWKFDNNETRILETFTNYSNQTFKYYSELYFNSFKRSDNGSYSCYADSTIISKISINVPSQPSKPRNIILKSINDSTIYVNWKIDDTGDYPVTGISIEWQEGGIVRRVEDIVRMTTNYNGSVYNAKIPDGSNVQIRVRNALGYSPASDSVKYLVTSSGSEEGMSTQTLIIAIVVPIVVLAIIAVIVIVWIRKRRVKITKI